MFFQTNQSGGFGLHLNVIIIIIMRSLDRCDGCSSTFNSLQTFRFFTWRLSFRCVRSTFPSLILNWLNTTYFYYSTLKVKVTTYNWHCALWWKVNTFTFNYYFMQLYILTSLMHKTGVVNVLFRFSNSKSNQLLHELIMYIILKSSLCIVNALNLLIILSVS